MTSVYLNHVQLVLQFKYYGGEDFDTLSNEPLLQDQEIVVEVEPSSRQYGTIN